MLKNLYLDKYIAIYLFVCLSYIFLFNLFNYSIFYGYDAEAHIAYVDYIAMYLPNTFRLPLQENTYEFFSPPLPYIFPAIIQVVCRNIFTSNDLVSFCQPIYGKITQIFQTFLYISSLYFYMKTLKILGNKKKLLNINLLLLISILTVNYRSFLMIRGEPYIIFFLSLLLYLFTKNYKLNFEFGLKNIIIFSLVVGSLGISRQWGLLLLPSLAIILFYFNGELRKSYFKFMLFVFIISMIIILPFYIYLYSTSGSAISFNKDPMKFSFSNQPNYFYNPINEDALKIFTKPIRGNFDNQLFPILYSDLWGDYWGYFSFTSSNLEQGRNQLLIGDYLARVNLISLLPTFVLILSLFNLKKTNINKQLCKYIQFSILFTFFGYIWFLIRYPEIPTGDTIKSTYILQLFHLIAFSAAIYLDDLREKNFKLYYSLVFLLLGVFTHNISAMLSHF